MIKQNRFVNWFKKLTKRKKIYFFLWIFIPLFIVILVASLLGTTLSNYYKNFSLDVNKITYTSSNFNQVFDENTKTNQYTLNLVSLENILANNSIKRDFKEGRNPNDWSSYLKSNDLMIYLELGNGNSSDYEYIQLINQTTSMSISTNTIGSYNTSSVNENNGDGNNINNLLGSNSLPSYYNYEYTSLNSSFLFGQYNNFSSITLIISQIQQPHNQFPDIQVKLNNLP